MAPNGLAFIFTGDALKAEFTGDPSGSGSAGQKVMTDQMTCGCWFAFVFGNHLTLGKHLTRYALDTCQLSDGDRTSELVEPFKSQQTLVKSRLKVTSVWRSAVGIRFADTKHEERNTINYLCNKIN